MDEHEVASLSLEGLAVMADFMSLYSTHLSIYLTLLFAYCGGMYIAGAKLDRVQLLVATAVFVIAAELQAMGMYAWIAAAEGVVIRLQELNPALEAKHNFDLRRVIGIPLWQAGIIASLLFTWRVRHPKTE